jgi:AraC-like DNA-binding protein
MVFFLAYGLIRVYNVFIMGPMTEKNKQFHMRLESSESLALGQLARRAGMSKSQYLRQFIRTEAKKAKIPVDGQPA